MPTTYRIRPVTLLEQKPDYADLGRTVGIAAGADFPAYNLVRTNASGLAEALDTTTGATTNIAYAFEPATDAFFQAEGPGNSHTKSQVSLGYLRGVRIGITVRDAWDNSFIGQKHPVKQDATSKYAVIDAADTASTGVATILAVFGDQRGVTTGDSNVYVEAILDDAACLV